MKTTYSHALAVTALALAGALAGCGGREQPTNSPPALTGSGASVTAAALGSEAAAGPFQVSLTTEPAAPKVGDTRFRVTVTKDGQPVKEAAVTVSLSMPGMNMGGPTTTLQPVPKDTGGQYEGSASLGMGGEYQAKTTVTAGGDTGTAVFQFMATQ